MIILTLPNESIFTNPQMSQISAMFSYGYCLYLTFTFIPDYSSISATIGEIKSENSKEWVLPNQLRNTLYIKATAGDITGDYSITEEEQQSMFSILNKKHMYNPEADAVIFSIGDYSNFAQKIRFSDGDTEYVAIPYLMPYIRSTEGSSYKDIKCYLQIAYINSNNKIHRMECALSTPMVIYLNKRNDGTFSDTVPLNKLQKLDRVAKSYYELCVIAVQIESNTQYYKHYYFSEPIFSNNTITAYRFISGSDKIEVDATTGTVTEILNLSS